MQTKSRYLWNRSSLLALVGVLIGGPAWAGVGAVSGRPAEKTYANVKEPAPDRPIDLDAAPVTGPKEMPPLDPQHVPPVEDGLKTPEQIVRHRRLMDELWGTTLAQMYLAYLTDPADPVVIPGRARQIIEQMYADGEHVGKRLKLVSHLTTDLYTRGQMTEEVSRRALMFSLLTETYDKKGEDGGNAQMFSYALTTLILTAPLASKPFADEFNRLVHFVSHRCVGRRCGPFNASWARTGGLKNIATNYRFKRHMQNFLGLGGGGLFLYGVTRQQMPGFLRSHTKDDKMLNGRDELVEQAEF